MDISDPSVDREATRAQRVPPEGKLLDKVREVWDIDQWFPTLRSHSQAGVSCPACESRTFGVRSWKYHHRPMSSHTRRCDVMVKCYRCSMTWCHGVPVPEEWYPSGLLVIGTVHHSEVESQRRVLKHWRKVLNKKPHA